MKIQYTYDMAKNINPIIRLQGSFQNMVFVKSKAYGDHVRSVRGSKKAAAINETLQAHADKTAVINNAAKKVHDLLKVYAGNFKESLLWQQLLSRMRKSLSHEFDALLQSLNGLEINSKYPLKRFGKIPVAAIEVKRQKLLLTFQCYTQPFIKNNTDCYYYEACVLFFSSKKESDCYLTTQTTWIKINEQPATWLFEFEIPARTKYYLVCLKMQSGIAEVEQVTMGSMGIGVVNSGRFQNFFKQKQG